MRVCVCVCVSVRRITTVRCAVHSFEQSDLLLRVWIMCVDYVRGLYMWLAHHLLVVVRVPGFKPFHIASSYMIYIGVLY